MSHLLACTDGSRYAPSIYDHAAWAASRMNLGVKILHVLDPHREQAQGTDLSGAIGFDASAELTEELVKLEETQARVARLKGDAILADARRHLQESNISPIETIQRHGTLVDTLAELEPQAELVVIGKRGQNADNAKGHLGSQLERVIRTSVRPVLVAARAFRPIDNLLLAFDGGPSALKALEFLLTNPLTRDLHCHLLRAGRPDENARTALQEAAQSLQAAGYQVTTETAAGNPEEVIAGYVKEKQINLLVMGAYGHSPIRRFILGSTTTTMVRTCLIPVLMFR